MILSLNTKVLFLKITMFSKIHYFHRSTEENMYTIAFKIKYRVFIFCYWGETRPLMNFSITPYPLLINGSTVFLTCSTKIHLSKIEFQCNVNRKSTHKGVKQEKNTGFMWRSFDCRWWIPFIQTWNCIVRHEYCNEAEIIFYVIRNVFLTQMVCSW